MSNLPVLVLADADLTATIIVRPAPVNGEVPEALAQ